MNVFNPASYRGVRYRFETGDRINIRGVEYGFIRSNTEGVWLQRAGADFPIEFFAHSVIGRMLAVGQLKVQRAIQSVQAPTSPGKGEETLSNLTGRIRAELRNRHIIVLEPPRLYRRAKPSKDCFPWTGRNKRRARIRSSSANGRFRWSWTISMATAA